jgi:hypothetical protein
LANFTATVTHRAFTHFAVNIIVYTRAMAYIFASKELRRVHQNREQQVSNVVDTICRRMQRSEDLAAIADETASMSEAQSVGVSPSCVSHARFAAMSARLAQVAAKASADSLSLPAHAHDPAPMEHVLRLLTDVRRITDAIAEFAAGDSPVSRNGGRT